MVTLSLQRLSPQPHRQEKWDPRHQKLRSCNYLQLEYKTQAAKFQNKGNVPKVTHEMYTVMNVNFAPAGFVLIVHAWSGPTVRILLPDRGLQSQCPYVDCRSIGGLPRMPSSNLQL